MLYLISLFVFTFDSPYSLLWPFSFKDPLFQWAISVKGYFEASPNRTTHTSYVPERECLKRDLFLSAGSDFDRAIDKSSSFFILSFLCLLTLFRFRKTWWNCYIQSPKDYTFFVQSPTSTVIHFAELLYKLYERHWQKTKELLKYKPRVICKNYKLDV